MQNPERTITFTRAIATIQPLLFKPITAKVILSLTIMSCLLTAFWGLPLLKTEFNFDAFSADKSESIQSDHEIKQRYGISEAPKLILTIHSENRLTTLENLAAIDSLHQQYKALNSVAMVNSLSDIKTLYRNETEDRFLSLANQDLPNQRRQQTLVWLKKNIDFYLNAKEKTTHFIIEAKEGVSAETLKAEIETVNLPIGLTSEMASVALYQERMASLLSHELSILGLIGLMLSVLSLMMLFKGYSGLVSSGVSCAVAVLTCLGLAGLFNETLTLLSLSLPILLSVQSLSLSIHTLFKSVQIRKGNHTACASELAWQTLKAVLAPNVLVTLTTLIGFLTLIPNDVSAIRSFGLVVSFSSATLLVINTLLTWSMLVLLPPVQFQNWVNGNAKWALAILRNPRKVGFAFLVASLLAVLSGFQIQMNHRLLADDPEFARQLKGIALLPVEIEIETQQTSFLSEPIARVFTKYIEELRAIPGVGLVNSYLDPLSIAGADLSTTASLSINEAVSFFELSGSNPLKGFLRNDGRMIRVSLRLYDLPSDQITNALAQIRILTDTFVGNPAHKGKYRIGGWGSFVHQMNLQLTRDLLFGFFPSLGMILLVLIPILRSPKWSFTATLPNLLPPMFLLAALSYLKIEVKPALGIVFSIALGFAFNNTVYLLETLKKNLRSAPLKSRAQFDRILDRTFLKESQACLVSTLTLLMGFVVLCFSQFSVMQAFGGAMVFSMISGLLGDLVLLPALLKLYPGLIVNPAQFRSSAQRSQFKPQAIIGLFILLSSTLPTYGAGLSLEQIGEKLKAHTVVRDESSRIRLKNVESNGDQQERVLEMTRLNDKKKEYLKIRILSPASLKGTAVLVVTDGKSQNRWVYLPSSHQVRRVAADSDDAHSALLGSELSSEDLNLDQVQGATAKIISQNSEEIKIESLIRDPKSLYSKCEGTLKTAPLEMAQVFCADKKGKPFKEIRFSNYKELAGKYSRPSKIQITNLLTRRKTEIDFENQKVKLGLRPADFTPDSLKMD